MIDLQYWSIERAAGSCLVLGFVALLVGVLMFLSRGGLRGGTPPSRAYFVWERSFIMAAVVLTVIGFVLLEGYFQNTDGRVLINMGVTTYLFGGVLVVAAEALSLTLEFEKLYGLVVIYVVMALLAQAAIGSALLQSGLLPAWIGWVTILWNIAWLVVLPVTSPRDIYYPGLHHLMPLLIGIALLRS